MSAAPQTSLRTLPVGKLVTLRRNPQYLTPKQMDALKASIQRDGFCVPILVRPVDRGRYEIVSGNHRYMAACELGFAEIPCVVATLTDRQRDRLAVNLNTVHGEPNAEILAPFLAELDRDVLREIHVEDALRAELVKFDESLAAMLAELQPPEALDRESPKHRQDTCSCPTCGRVHVRKSGE